jgi:glycerol-3-phosphate dehydrogenase
VVVNATGPWSHLTAESLGQPSAPLTWLKGTHLLMNRARDFGADALVMHSVRDHRLLWAIPWENRLVVGTTESRFSGDLRDVRPTADEVEDLFQSFVRGFPGLKSVRSDIQGAYAGVRPIVDQPCGSDNELSRRFQVRVEHEANLITVMGGKLTTFRLMAERAVDAAAALLGLAETPRNGRADSRSAPLWPALTRPEWERLVEELRAQHGDGIDPTILDHLARHYGHDVWSIVAAMQADPAAGRPLCDGLPYTPAECAYLCRTESVHHLLDLIKRRTPLYFLAGREAVHALNKMTRYVAPLLGWNRSRQQAELAAAEREFLADVAALGDLESASAASFGRVECA